MQKSKLFWSLQLCCRFLDKNGIHTKGPISGKWLEGLVVGTSPLVHICVDLQWGGISIVQIQQIFDLMNALCLCGRFDIHVYMGKHDKVQEEEIT